MCVCVPIWALLVVNSVAPSWGRSKLKVPGEDVIGSDSVHRDGGAPGSLGHSLPHRLKRYEIWWWAAAVPSSNYPLVNLYPWECVARWTNGWSTGMAAVARKALALWHNSFILAPDPVLSESLQSCVTGTYWHSSAIIPEAYRDINCCW